MGRSAAGNTGERVQWLEGAARGAGGITSMRGHLVPLAVSAVLLGLAFPQPGWGWLAHVALVPAVVVAIRAASWRRLAWCAGAVFFLWWVVMLRWLMPVTAGGYVLLAAFMALWWVAALLAVRGLHAGWGWPATLALPVAWVALEVLRDHVPAGGFGWFMLGYSQAAFGPEQGAGRLVQVADLFGVYGVSVLVAMSNGLLVDLLTRSLTRRTAGGALRPGRAVTIAAAVWLTGLVAAWGYGQYRINEHEQVTTPGPRLAVVQTNVPQDNKIAPTPESQQRDWQALMELTHQAGEGNEHGLPELIVWPETVVPTALNREARAYLSDAPAYDDALSELARQLGAPLLVGAHAYHDFVPERLGTGGPMAVPQRSHNSVYLYDVDGDQSPRRYDKVHRVPFGEYVPWVERVPALKQLFIRYLTPYEHDYTLDPGERFTVFELGRGEGGEAPALRFATPICFEDAVARVGRRMVYDDAGEKRVDALVNLTNDGWFHGLGSGGAMRAQHVQIASLRTIENRVPMARSVNTGNSAMIDSLGRVRDALGPNVAGTLHGELRPDTRSTLYGRLGELPAWIVVVIATMALLGPALRRGKVDRRVTGRGDAAGTNENAKPSQGPPTQPGSRP